MRQQSPLLTLEEETQPWCCAGLGSVWWDVTLHASGEKKFEIEEE